MIEILPRLLFPSFSLYKLKLSSLKRPIIYLILHVVYDINTFRQFFYSAYPVVVFYYNSQTNRTSWSVGKGTSAEMPAITNSNSGHSGFNMVSVWFSGPSSPVPIGCGRIVGLSEKSGYLDY